MNLIGAEGRSVSVAVRDRRREVVDKSKTEDFVGSSRSLTGIPYNVHTKSGHPLAQDITEDLTASLQKRGVKARQILVPSQLDDAKARASVIPPSSELCLLVTLHSWDTDFWARLSLTYDVGVDVIDSTGAIVANSAAAGTEVLGDGETVKPGFKNLPQAVATIFKGLLNAPTVTAALNGSAPPVAAAAQVPAAPPPAPSPSTSAATPKAVTAVSTSTPPATPAAAAPSASPAKGVADPPKAKKGCSVAQILKMKDAGLSDEQVKAACE